MALRLLSLYSCFSSSNVGQSSVAKTSWDTFQFMPLLLPGQKNPCRLFFKGVCKIYCFYWAIQHKCNLIKLYCKVFINHMCSVLKERRWVIPLRHILIMWTNSTTAPFIWRFGEEALKSFSSAWHMAPK